MTFTGFETDNGVDSEELHVYTSGEQLKIIAVGLGNEQLVEVQLGYEKLCELASLLNSMQWRLQREREAAAK